MAETPIPGVPITPTTETKKGVLQKAAELVVLGQLGVESFKQIPPEERRGFGARVKAAAVDLLQSQWNPTTTFGPGSPREPSPMPIPPDITGEEEYFYGLAYRIAEAAAKTYFQDHLYIPGEGARHHTAKRVDDYRQQNPEFGQNFEWVVECMIRNGATDQQGAADCVDYLELTYDEGPTRGGLMDLFRQFGSFFISAAEARTAEPPPRPPVETPGRPPVYTPPGTLPPGGVPPPIRGVPRRPSPPTPEVTGPRGPVRRIPRPEDEILIPRPDWDFGLPRLEELYPLIPARLPTTPKRTLPREPIVEPEAPPAPLPGPPAPRPQRLPSTAPVPTLPTPAPGPLPAPPLPRRLPRLPKIGTGLGVGLIVGGGISLLARSIPGSEVLLKPQLPPSPYSPTPSPISPFAQPFAQPQATRTRTKREVCEKRREKDRTKCRIGWFREKVRGTTFETWRTVDCLTGKYISEKK